MEEMMEDNGNGAAPRPRNRFGPEPHQEIPAEVADIMLTELASKHPAQFGRLLTSGFLSRNGTPFEVARPGRPAGS